MREKDSNFEFETKQNKDAKAQEKKMSGQNKTTVYITGHDNVSYKYEFVKDVVFSDEDKSSEEGFITVQQEVKDNCAISSSWRTKDVKVFEVQEWDEAENE